MSTIVHHAQGLLYSTRSGVLTLRHIAVPLLLLMSSS